MKYKTYLTIISLAQILLIAAFFRCAWLADKAMDKTGIGNLELNQQYNSYAGIAFYIAVVLWVTSIVMAIFGKCFKEKHAQIAIGLPPLFFIATLLAVLAGCTAKAPYNQNIEGIVLRGDNAIENIRVRFLSAYLEGACDAPGLEAVTNKDGKFTFSQKYVPSVTENYAVVVHPYRLCIFIDGRWQQAWSVSTGPAPGSIVFKCYVAEDNKKIEKCFVSWDKQEFK
jgi:hypothetical protein